MGGLDHGLRSRVVLISSTSAWMARSSPPMKRFIFHTIALRLASYLALPVSARTRARARMR